MGDRGQERIIELQRALKIAKAALEKISTGHCGYKSPEFIAEEALYQMSPLDRKLPLQGLVGHERRRP